MKPKICEEEVFIRTIVPTKDALPGAKWVESLNMTSEKEETASLHVAIARRTQCMYCSTEAMNQKANITPSYISEVIPLGGQEVMINPKIHE